MAGRVGVPELEIARMRAELQRLDLIEGCFSEGERALVFVVRLDHVAKGRALRPPYYSGSWPTRAQPREGS